MKTMDTMTDTDGGLLSILQAMEYLNCGKKKIYQLHRAGKIDMVKLGHSTRVTEASLRRLINELPRK
jgi:excisionase family DNA binding protein